MPKLPVLTASTLLLLGLLTSCSDEPADAGASPTGSAGPTASGTPDPGSPSATPSDSPTPTQSQLPRGGRTIFPQHQLVGFVGLPGSPALGPLDSDLDTKAARLEKISKSYAAGRTPLPVMELIVVIANAHPGPDDQYRSRLTDAKIKPYLDAARKHKMLLLLAVQPGRADGLTEVRRLEKWLKEPDVGLSYDPEWAVGPGEVPGRVFGRTTGPELTSIATYLSGLTTKYDLPEKVFVFHQLSARILSKESSFRQQPGVVTIKSVDGIGARADKVATWSKLTPKMAPGVHAGFKLFYEEDTRHGPLMTPAQVLALKPRPEFVVYE